MTLVSSRASRTPIFAYGASWAGFSHADRRRMDKWLDGWRSGQAASWTNRLKVIRLECCILQYCGYSRSLKKHPSLLPHPQTAANCLLPDHSSIPCLHRGQRKSAQTSGRIPPTSNAVAYTYKAPPFNAKNIKQSFIAKHRASYSVVSGGRYLSSSPSAPASDKCTG